MPSISYSAITEDCTVHVKQSALAGFMADEDWSSKATFVADIPETTFVPNASTDTAQPRYYDLMGRPVRQDYKGLKISDQGKVSIVW